MSLEKDTKDKQDRVKYKFGQKELDLDNYIYNLGTNVQSYIQNKNWSEGQKQEFMNAYELYLTGLKDLLAGNTNRFSTDDFGVIIDNDGILSDNTAKDIYYYNNKGERISSDDYNNLKERKQKNYSLFSANREVATYFNKIGKAIKAKTKDTKPESKTKFEVSKHGFVADWQLKNGTSGEKIDLLPYLDKDVYDPVTKKRARTERLKYLSDEILNYLDNFNSDAYDFTGSSFGNGDTYKEKLSNLVSKMKDGTWDNEDMIAANLAGIGGSFYDYFFSEDEFAGKTEDQIKAELEAAKAKEEEEKRKEYLKRQDNFIKDSLAKYKANNYLYSSANPFSFSMNKDYFDDNGVFDFKKYNSTFPVGTDVKSFLDNYLVNPYDVTNIQRAWAGLIGTGQAKKLEDGRYYMPQARNDETQSVLVYDPANGSLYHTFIGDIKPEWERITRNFRLNSGLELEHEQYRFKEGGIIQHQLGGNVDINRILQEGQIELEKQRAKASGRTLEQQQAGERNAGLPFGADQDPSMGDPNAGFSGTDALRLGTIGADIISMLASFGGPVGSIISAGTGLASSVGTFAADWAEDGLDWGDAGNLLTNVGLDLLGAIPGGGASSKAVKIAKSLGKWTNRIVAAVGAMSTLQNGDAIINSLNKLTKEPTKLTVDDWRNISLGIGLVTGIGGAAGRAYHRSKNTPKPKLDVVAVEMFDKNTKQKQTYLFDGDDAKAIKLALKTGDLEALKKATTSKYEGMKDLEISTTGNTGWRGFHDSDAKWNKGWHLNPIGEKSGNPRVFDISTDKNGRPFVKTGTLQDDITDFRTPGKTTADIDAKIKTELFDPLTAVTSKVKSDLEKQGVKAESIKRTIEDYKKKINGDTAETMEAKIKEIVANQLCMKDNDIATKLADKQKLDSDLADAKVVLEVALKKVFAYKSRKNTDPEKINAKIELENAKIKVGTLEGEILKFNNAHADYGDWKAKVDNASDAKLTEAKDRKANVKKWLKDLEAKLKHVDNYEARKKKYEEGKIHTDEFKAILNKFGIKSVDDKFNFDRSKYGGRGTVETTLKDLLNQYGITTYYKLGGSFNHVRKFQKAGKLTNTTSKANWFDDMFSSPEMAKWIGGFNVNNFEDFNNLQRSWATNRVTTGYVPGVTHLSTSKNLGVWDRQGLWNTTGTNAAIERAFSNGKINRAGSTGDNSLGNYLDGFFGELEFLRHGGTKESWSGKETQLRDFQNALQKVGLNYTLDEDTGMYLMSKINTSKKTQDTPEVKLESTKTKPLQATPEPEFNEEIGYDGKNLLSFLNNPTLKYGVPRAFLADAANKRMTRMAIAGEKPYLQNPDEYHRSIKSDLNAEMLGLTNAAKLTSTASKPLTSDGSLQTATMLEALAKGLEFINLGKAKSDAILRESQEAAWLQEKENAKNRHNVVAQNKLSMLQTMANKNKIKLAYESKKHNIYDTLLLQLEAEAKGRAAEEKAKKEPKEEALVLAEIKEAVKYDPNKFGANLTEDELSVWNKMVAGADYTSLDLSSGENKLYLQAKAKVDLAERKQLSKYYGILPSRWSGVRKFQQDLTIRNDDDIPGLKNGGKVKVAGIKAKTADAERFLKAILASIERNEKVLDRLSKSMYGYIKASIVK